MSVTVDQQAIGAEELGLKTVGQVLARLQREKRLVVRLLIDGEAPDFKQIEAVRAVPLAGRTIFIETADPNTAAMETVIVAQQQLAAAETLKGEAVALLRSDQWTAAMQKLGKCLGNWLEAQQAASAVAKLSGIQLEQMRVESRSMAEWSATFAEQLRQIQTALQANDLVGLIDLLVYETAETGLGWKSALGVLAVMIPSAGPVKSAA